MDPFFLLVPYWLGDSSPAWAKIARYNWKVFRPSLPEGEAVARMAALDRALAEEVAAIRAADHLPIVITGDCTQPIGVLAGLQVEGLDPLLVWYDAHGDFNTPETTPSGFIGGMPLAMLCGRGEQTIVAGAGASVLPEGQVILTDARDLDPGEKEAVAGSGITHLPDVAGLLDLDLPAEKPIYIHFDCDVLDLADLAAIDYPAEGGPAMETVEASLARLADTGRVAAVSVTLWNPDKDEDGSAGRVVLGLVDRLVERLRSR